MSEGESRPGLVVGSVQKDQMEMDGVREESKFKETGGRGTLGLLRVQRSCKPAKTDQRWAAACTRRHPAL